MKKHRKLIEGILSLVLGASLFAMTGESEDTSAQMTLYAVALPLVFLAVFGLNKLEKEEK